MAEKYRASPSGAEGWMICHGKPRMESRFPETEISRDRAEGIAKHQLRQNCLESGKDIEDFVGDFVEAAGYRFEVQPIWATWIQPGIDRIRDEKAEWVFEHQVSVDPWMPGKTAIIDAAGIQPDRVIIDDFKGGRGIIVEAERCKQLMIYALAFWMDHARHVTDVKKFLLRIDQPAAPGGGSEWEVTLEELLVFAEELAAAYTATQQDDARLQPAPAACQLCRAARNAACYALDQFVLELMGLSLEDLDVDPEEAPTMIEYDTLSPERRAYLYKHKQLMSAWVKNQASATCNDAVRGTHIPGFKPVATLGDRGWKDPEAAEAFWKSKMPANKIYTQKLKSVAQMELVAGTRNWAKAQELIERPDGPVALVPESDPRPALLNMDELLEDLPDEETEIPDSAPESDEYTDDLI